MLNKICLIVLLCFVSIFMHAQESWMMKGYVKGMTSMQTAGDDGQMTIENTIYNRFDFNW